MPYFPGIPPENIDDFRRWLGDELNRINDGVQEGQEYQGFKIHHAEPDKYEIGQVVFADGTDWDPGSGQGTYERTNLGWQKLGEGTGVEPPTSHSALLNLDADDHLHYHTDARGDARYYTQAQIDARHLSNLSDVTLSGPVNGEVLTYNDVLMMWENAPGGSGGDGNLDGGRADTIYTPPQVIDGGPS